MRQNAPFKWKFPEIFSQTPPPPGRGTPAPRTTPLGAFGASILVPTARVAPRNWTFWIRPCVVAASAQFLLSLEVAGVKKRRWAG